MSRPASNYHNCLSRYCRSSTCIVLWLPSNHKLFSQMMYYIETRLLAKNFTVWGQVYMERRKDFIPELMFVIVDVCFDDGFAGRTT